MMEPCMSGGYIGLIWMDTDGELMKPVLWIQLRALSLSLSLSLSLFLSLSLNIIVSPDDS